MAILLCNECGHLREVRSEYAGKSVICPQCKQDNTVHDTIRFLKYLIGKYREKNRELQSLKEQLAPVAQEESADAAESEDSTIAARQLLSDVDIHNTTTLADPQQYRPIVTWMNQRGIRLDIDHQAIDTTGFFDEVAVRLGDGYETLKLVSNQIKFIRPGGRGQLPTRGSHGSGRAQFGHPAPQIMVSLLNGTHCARRAQGGGDRC